MVICMQYETLSDHMICDIGACDHYILLSWAENFWNSMLDYTDECPVKLSKYGLSLK